MFSWWGPIMRPSSGCVAAQRKWLLTAMPEAVKDSGRHTQAGGNTSKGSGCGVPP